MQEINPWHSIAIFCNKRQSYYIIFELIMPLIDGKVDLLIYPANERGYHIFLYFRREQQGMKEFLYKVDYALKQYFQLHPTEQPPERLPNNSFFKNFPIATVHYDVVTKTAIKKYQISINSLQLFENTILKISKLILNIFRNRPELYSEDKTLIAVELIILTIKNSSLGCEKGNKICDFLFKKDLLELGTNNIDKIRVIVENEYKSNNDYFIMTFSNVWYDDITRSVPTTIKSEISNVLEKLLVIQDSMEVANLVTALIAEIALLLGVEKKAFLFFSLSKMFALSKT